MSDRPGKAAKRRRPKWCTNEDCVEDHVAHAKDGGVELILVGGSKPYVWVGLTEDRVLDRLDGRFCGALMGRVKLRRFAKAILKEVGRG